MEGSRAESVYCASYQLAVELLGKRWNGAILAVLQSRTHRFSELANAVPGLSERVLAERLRELESARVIARRVLPGPPVGVEYELTEAGQDLNQAIRAVSAWAQKWIESGSLPVRA
jgi:DNA-binding HxlR family transcriptional regulator